MTRAKHKNLGDAEIAWAAFLATDEGKRAEELFMEIIVEMRKRLHPDTVLLRKAFTFSGMHHVNRRRLNGEPFIYHPLEVGKILAEAGFENDLVAAGILHDMMEECGVERETLVQKFGSVVAEIVDAISDVNASVSQSPNLTKLERDVLADVKLLIEVKKKGNLKAFYVKLAERIHNLRTINCFPEEKQLAKAMHTRLILIPEAKRLHIFELVNILESLCLEIEDPRVYKQIRYGYQQILSENRDVLEGKNGLKEFWKKLVFDPNSGCEGQVVSLEFRERYEDSIYRHLNTVIAKNGKNKNHMKEYISKKYIPLYDINFTLFDFAKKSPEKVFFSIYPSLHESRFGITIMGIGKTKGSGMTYYKLEDGYGNHYRLFLQRETEFLEYTYGMKLTGEGDTIRSHLPYINEAEPDLPERKKIPVYRKDGSLMYIEEGSTILDFAFALNINHGICCLYGLINGLSGKMPLHHRLQAGNIVEIVSDHTKGEEQHDIPHACIRWFEYLHTREAIKALSRWMEANMEYAANKIMVLDEKGKQFELDRGSTVLDLAFAIDPERALYYKKARLNECLECIPMERVLRYRDRVKFMYADEVTAKLSWLRIVKTKAAKEALITYFEQR